MRKNVVVGLIVFVLSVVGAFGGISQRVYAECSHPESCLRSRNFSIDEDGALHFTVYCDYCSEEQDSDLKYEEEFILPQGSYLYSENEATCTDPAYIFVGPLRDENNDPVPVHLSIGIDYSAYWKDIEVENSELNLDNHLVERKNPYFDEEGNLHMTAFCEDCGEDIWNEEKQEYDYIPAFEEEVVFSKDQFEVRHFENYCEGDGRYEIYPKEDSNGQSPYVVLSSNQTFALQKFVFNDGVSADPNKHIGLFTKKITIDEAQVLTNIMECYACSREVKYILTKDEYTVKNSEPGYVIVDFTVINGYGEEEKIIEKVYAPQLNPEIQPQTILASKASYTFTYKPSKAQSSVLSITGAKGKLTYTSSNSKYVTVKSGKVYVAKGAPAGKYTIKVKAEATEGYEASDTIRITVNVVKANNTLTVSPTGKTFRYSDVKKAAKSFLIKATNAKGKVTYRSSSRKVLVSSRGKVTIKKGTAKGTYKIMVEAAGSTNYKSGTKTIKIIIK